jgi:hypothetical protein
MKPFANLSADMVLPDPLGPEKPIFSQACARDAFLINDIFYRLSLLICNLFTIDF